MQSLLCQENLQRLWTFILISEGGLNILNVEALIEELNDPNNQYTESQFIEQLKSCYK